MTITLLDHPTPIDDATCSQPLIGTASLAALGDAEPPQTLSIANGIQFERIAALRPDLILATDSYSIEQDYERLSKIAPTLSPKSGVGVDGWQTMTGQIAPALGRTDEAAELVMSVE